METNSCYKRETNLHYLPFKMNYNGEAEVDTYFESLIKKDEDKTGNDFKTSFRGRIFNGKRFDTYKKTKDLNKIENDEDQNDFGILYANYKKDENNYVVFQNETNFFCLNKLICDLGKLA